MTHKTTALLAFLAVCGLIGFRLYNNLDNWNHPGDDHFEYITGNSHSVKVMVKESVSFDAVLDTSLFSGFYPGMESYPNNQEPDGYIVEGNVDYAVFGVDKGRMLLHSYFQADDRGVNSADILEFRPSAMTLDDMFLDDFIKGIPESCNPSWVLVDKKDGNTSYVIELEGDLVRRFVWRGVW